MPYIKKEARGKYDEVVFHMKENLVHITHLPWILFAYCRLIKPSYNNYKNFIGELRQCAAEIKRRKLTIKKLPLERMPIPTLYLRGIVDLMALKKVEANGDLNYILFKYCKYHTGNRERFIRVLLRCANKIEKELLGPYEDEKIKENGDV